MKQRYIFFFIGTEAELIKIFPVVAEIKKREIPYKIIASGQNDITDSAVFCRVKIGRVDVELSKEADIKKSAFGLFSWCLKTYCTAKNKIKAAFADADFAHSIMVVHGDTVSTVLGAKVGKQLGMQIAHVEAGLRSHNLLNPFPEEIDRMLTSHYATISFAPGKDACANLKRKKTGIIDTHYNSVLDSLNFSRTLPCEDSSILALQNSRYFVFVLHRQENLAHRALVEAVILQIRNISKEMQCVCILHKTTEIALENYGLLDALRAESNISMLSRRQYFDFMKLLDNAQFVITDGGSNQEELSYMGKPCLILRNYTERSDGLGENAVLYQGNVGAIPDFALNYKQYCRASVSVEDKPSSIIAETLAREVFDL
ncbi:MAG: UDP-N-acetylglucosamine 2-epimerase [Ruthenibacterium sp.]